MNQEEIRKQFEARITLLCEDEDAPQSYINKVLKKDENFRYTYPSVEHRFSDYLAGYQAALANSNHESIKFAFNEFIEKTEFVQKDEHRLFFECLGMHRADAMRHVIEAQQVRIVELEAALASKQEPVQFLYDMTPPPEFLEYIRKNYSGEVNFHDPDWHAMRLWNAAMKNFKPPYIDFPFKDKAKQEHIESNQEYTSQQSEEIVEKVSDLVGTYLFDDVSNLDLVNAFVSVLSQPKAIEPAQEHIESNQKPIAWEFIGIAGFIKYVSQRRYELFTDKVKQWYKPFKCSSCNRHKAIEPAQDNEGWIDWNDDFEGIETDKKYELQDVNGTFYKNVKFSSWEHLSRFTNVVAYRIAKESQ